MELLIPILVLAGIVLIPLVWVISIYNKFARLRQHIRESWSGIEVEMKRRYDLIPNLVATVQGYAQHERDTLEQITKLRNAAMENHGSAESQATDECALMLGMKKLFALAEAYPDLKANEQFLALQKQLSLTEDRIAAARRFYNGNTREMNQLCAQFPSNIVARVFGFEPGTFFELPSEAERVVPRVDW